MKTVEILAGSTFSNAVTALGLTSAMLTYHYHPAPESYREDYQVWLLSKDDLITSALSMRTIGRKTGDGGGIVLDRIWSRL